MLEMKGLMFFSVTQGETVSLYLKPSGVFLNFYTWFH